MLADRLELNLEQIQSLAFPNSTPLSQLSVASIISTILPYIFGAAGIGLLIYMLLGGFQMMTSRGDPKAVQSAQAKITNALIGFIIVFFAYAIVQIIGQILGLQGTLFSKIFSGT